MKTTILYLICGLLLAISTIGILDSVEPTTWDNWKPATCMLHGCFCESVRRYDSIRQPANTWSSLAFVLSSSTILVANHKRRKTASGSRLSSGLLSLFTLSIVIIGVGSAFFHASLTLVGQFFDVFGMYLLTSFMLVYALTRLFTWHYGITIFTYVLANVFLSGLLIEVPETRRYAFAVVLLLAIIFEIVVRRLRAPQIEVWWWNSGLLLFLIGYVIWIFDNTKLLCNPDSLLQGHSIWHILGAVAVFCLFRYYHSEQVDTQPSVT